MTHNDAKKPSDVAKFESLAQEEQPGILADFWDFIVHNKRWWLTPIIVILLLVGALYIFAATVPAATPFIYTFF